MDPELYQAATEGNIFILQDLIQFDAKVLTSATPQGNTVLHIAARHGHKDFAEEILKVVSSLLFKQNAEEETPLHIAARAGHRDVVAVLISYSLTWNTDIEGGEQEQVLLRMTNKLENTPLHEAVKNRNTEIALQLLNFEPGAAHMVNAKRETPLHIAAREGLEDVVWEVIQHPWVGGQEEQQPPSGIGSPLHQAVMGGHDGIMRMLLRERKDLIPIVDDLDNNALHYAAHKNDGKMVWMLLTSEHSLAYGKNWEGQSPLHVAAAYGSNSAIKEILKQCPDAAEQVDPTGKNALHIAVVNRTVGALTCLLKNIDPPDIINQADEDGNTPLHLAAKNSRIHSALLLLKDERVDPCLPNKNDLTPRKIIESLDAMDTYEMYILQSLKKSEKRKCKKHPQFSEFRAYQKPVKKKMTTADEHFKSCVGTYTLVAVLIATVTFAASFTLPGGYDQTNGHALLVKRPAFKVFVISNTIAMCSSLIVVFCFIWAWKDPLRFKFQQLIWGHRLTVVACLAMIVAFMTAVYVVVAHHCQWLAIVVCLICCSAPFILWAILGHDILFIPV